jgi:hypothetical protein
MSSSFKRNAAEPLLGEGSENAEPAKERPPWRWLCLLAGGLCLYIVLGAAERVAFARMTYAMPSGVLLMHTLLALLSLLMFTILQCARSQSSGPAISTQLQQLHVADVLSMTFLDVLHSLLALSGAPALPGVVQAMLIQSTVAAATLFGTLFAPPTSDGAPSKSLRLDALHLINHHSPAEIFKLVCRSPRTYEALGALAITITVIHVALAPLPSDADAPLLLQRSFSVPARSVRAGGDLAAISALESPVAAPTHQLALAYSKAGSPETEAVPVVPSTGTPEPLISGQFVFLLSCVVSAFASAHKRRCLSQRPVDVRLPPAFFLSARLPSPPP